MDPLLPTWLGIIECLVSNRDFPFSALGGIIDKVPYTVDDLPSHIREGLALRCLEELKATLTSASSGKIDASQTREKVLLSKIMQKNSESSQPNASYSKECNNLPEVSNSHRDDHERNSHVCVNKGGRDRSANGKALSSKISGSFSKRNRREKAYKDDNYRGAIENKRTNRSSLKGLRERRNQQTQWTAMKKPRRRPKLIWKPEEEEALEKAMQKIPPNDDGRTSWIKILEYCRPVLHKSRTPIDLKDKWRNMQIREAKNRG